MRDGLPSNIIADLTQDQYGFLWIATRNGLTRYDGNEFLFFQKDSLLNSIPSNELTAVLADENCVWVGSWNGLSKINTVTFIIDRIELPNKKIRALSKGNDHTIWIGTAEGLLQYNSKENKYKLYNTSNNLSHNMVRSLYVDKNENVWVGTYDGLNILRKGENEFIRIPLLENKKTNTLVLAIKENKNCDDLWVGTEQGLFSIHPDLTVTSYLDQNKVFSNSVIKDIYQDKEGKLFLGTDFGLNIFNPETLENTTYFHNPRKSYSISNNAIRKIYKGDNDALWFSTLNGISRRNQNKNTYSVNELSYLVNKQRTGYQLKSTLMDSQGNLWFSTSKGVIQKEIHTGKEKYFNQENTTNKRIPIDNTFSLLEDKKGRIWIGTAAGISIWDTQKQKMYSMNVDSHPSLVSNYVGNIVQQENGTIWVSTWEGGIFKIDGDIEHLKDIVFTKIENLKSESEKFTVTNDAVWILDKNKLYKIPNGTLKAEEVTTFNTLFKNKEAYSIYQSDDNYLWVGTQNGVVSYSIKSDKFIFYPIHTQNDEIVRSCIQGDDGNIWCITNLTIIKLEPKSERLSFYPLHYNLPIKNFHFGCATKQDDGTLIFGGDNGFISFLPSDMKMEELKTSLFITGLEVNNKRIKIGETVDDRVLLHQNISFVDQLELNYSERSFTLNFSNLDFSNSNKNIYAYKLIGYDKNWYQISGAEHQAIYSNVKPGSYTFSVRAINNLGGIVTTSPPLSIVIKRPFLLQNIFLFLYFLIIIGLIFLGIRIYTNRLKLTNQLHITKMEVAHAEELEKTKEDYFTNISHELRTPISLILPPIREVQKNPMLDDDSKHLLSLAEKNANRLKKLVNQILDFNKMQYESLSLKFSKVDAVLFTENVFVLFSEKAAQSKINYTFHSDFETQDLWIDFEKMETVLFNLLSNAFKFTKDKGTIQLSIKKIEGDTALSENGIRIIISDSGVGISNDEQKHIFERFYQSKSQFSTSESGSGIGLTLVSEFVELHHGIIKVNSIEGEGTTFKIDLPLGTSHLPVDQIEKNEIAITSTPVTHHLDKKIASYKLDLNSDKPLVLVIDDNQDIVSFIRTSLRKEYNLITAENGEEGLVKATRFLPQIIISDVMMPVMDGLSFTEKVKKNPKTSGIPVILLTAKSMTSQKIEGVNSGADVYLTKPIEIDLLKAYVKSLLEKKEELETHFKKEIFNADDEINPLNNEDTIFVNKVMSIIEANISNPELNVEMLSQELSMSTTHLYRKLKATTNHTAKDVIKKHRLKKASQLLQNKEGNITEIVDQVGFSSLSYFSRVFKAEFKLSPKKYQEKYNADFQ